MYPITNEVKALFESEQRKVLRITGTDKNGATITITDNNVIEDSFQIDRYSCNGEKLEIGTAIAAQLTFKLENGNGQYDGIVFEGAELFVEVGIADWSQTNPTIHWVPCGYFTPDIQPRRMTTISITALDRMTNFDAIPPTLTPWTTSSGEYMTDSHGNIIYFLSNVRFPCTVAALVQRVALLCSVPFTQNLNGLPNANLIIDQLPVLEQQITYRNIIQWCAGIMGTNAWIDWTGSLRFSWYNNETGYVSSIDNRYSSDLYENDLTVTGVGYTNNSNIFVVAGTDEYALDMSGNYMAAAKISTILSAVNGALNGFTYRPFVASAINAPYLWPMDAITFTDKDGNNHSSVLTNVTFGLNGMTALQSKGETAETNSRVKPSGVNSDTAQMIERAAQVARDLDKSLTQEEIFNRLTDNGETQGLILYDGKVYLNAEYIQAGTLVANLLLAAILTIGGANNGNGSIRILDENGNVIGTWDKNGISVKKGSITGGEINGATLTLGGSGNASGTLTVKDANGNIIGTWDNNGLTLNKGSIAGPSVTLGGSNNTDGTLTVKDASNNTIGTWNNSGIDLEKGIINLNSTSVLRLNSSTSGNYAEFNSYGLHLVLTGNVVNTDYMSSGTQSESASFPQGQYSFYPMSMYYLGDENWVSFYSPFGLEIQKSSSTIRWYANYNTTELIIQEYQKYANNSWRATGRELSFYLGNSGYSDQFVFSGTKSRVVSTDQYSNRLLYCYETPTPMFGDIGNGVISDDGFCYVMLDAVFAQTITTEQYQVFLQKYGPGDCWVKERKGAYFIIEGTPGMSFGWEIKAKQRDYDQLRLERNDKKFTVPTQTYGEDAANHIDEIRKEREAA